jgi:hypothetical protein
VIVAPGGFHERYFEDGWELIDDVHNPLPHASRMSDVSAWLCRRPAWRCSGSHASGSPHRARSMTIPRRTPSTCFAAPRLVEGRGGSRQRVIVSAAGGR